MDYSQLSDQEINQLVIDTLILTGHFTDNTQEVSHRRYVSDGWCWGRGTETGLRNKDGTVFVTHQNGYRLDYCHDASSAWEIIPSHLISLEPKYEFMDESEEEIYPTGEWVSEHVFSDGRSIRVEDSNPLRAAMIVFLLMQDAKHD